MSKRYIEDVLPLGELNKTAQKGGGIGSLNAMHPYFARRPLTASRAMTLAALVNAPENDEDRKALEKLLVELSSEEWPDKPELLEKARGCGNSLVKLLKYCFQFTASRWWSICWNRLRNQVWHRVQLL